MVGAATICHVARRLVSLATRMVRVVTAAQVVPPSLAMLAEIEHREPVLGSRNVGPACHDRELTRS
jgi:hypothetical protein